MPNPPRLRFAPSPTGHLHIGGARTALFNWLLARQQKGQFILRLEDTDRERSTLEYEKSILEGLDWLGLHWDEGPFHQVDRFEVYRGRLEQLLKEGKAYRCFCPPQELEERRQAAQKRGEKPRYDGRCRNADQAQQKPHVVRFVSTDVGTTVVHDLIKGAVSFDNKELDDLIIQRTDGTPTYNFVVVVDDVDMKISHVIRGDDHLNNTPRQIQLYQAFGYPLPRFAHLPMILGPDKSRLSKRHGATSVIAYKEMGFLADALVNFLARIGWAYDDQQEIFSREELIEKFSLDKVGAAGGVFNQEKLLWLNGHYLRQTDLKTLAALLTPFLEAEGATVVPGDRLLAAIRTVQEKSKTLVEMAQASKFYFVEAPAMDEKARVKFLAPDNLALLKALRAAFAGLADFSEAGVKACVEGFLAERDLKLAQLAQPLRVALTGSTVSPGIFEVVTLLGKEAVLRRLDRVLHA